MCHFHASMTRSGLSFRTETIEKNAYAHMANSDVRPNLKETSIHLKQQQTRPTELGFDKYISKIYCAYFRSHYTYIFVNKRVYFLYIPIYTSLTLKKPSKVLRYI